VTCAPCRRRYAYPNQVGGCECVEGCVSNIASSVVCIVQHDVHVSSKVPQFTLLFVC